MPENNITREMVYRARSYKQLKRLVIEHCANTIGYLPSPPFVMTSDRTMTLIFYVLSFMPQEIISYVASHVAFFENADLSRKHQRGIATCLHKLSDDVEHHIIFDSMFNLYDNRYRCAVIAHEIGHAVKGQPFYPPESEGEANDFGELYGFPQTARQPIWKLHWLVWKLETPKPAKLLLGALVLIVISLVLYILFSR